MTLGRLVVVVTILTVGLQAYNVSRRYGPASSTNVSVHSPQPGTLLRFDHLPVRGERTANVAVVEFSDYECPYCAQHATTVEPMLEREFIRTGMIRYAFSNNPLPIHSRARYLAAAALCAGQQNRYWEMHDALFRNSPSTDNQVMEVATGIGADSATFQKCVRDDVGTLQAVDDESSKARELGLSVTPSFLVGKVTRDGQLSVSAVMSGVQPIEAFRKAISDASISLDGH